MKRHRILLTGSTGFLGRRLLSNLLRSFPESEIYTLSKNDNTAQPGVTRHFQCDLSDLPQAMSMLECVNADLIFHVAGRIAGNSWVDLHRDNVLTTCNLFEAATALKANPRVVLMGSAAEYGVPESVPVKEDHSLRPTSLYGIAKACQGHLAKYYSSSGVDVCGARIFNIVGRGCPTSLIFGRVLEQVLPALESKGAIPLRMGNLWPKRDFIDVRDVATGIVSIGKHGKPGEIYNLCSGRSIAIGEVLRVFENILERPFEVISDAGRASNLEVDDIYGSYEKLNKLSQWQPRFGLEQSIANAIFGD